MKILLETRCGCRREVEWTEIAPEIDTPTRHINLPLMPAFGIFAWLTDAEPLGGRRWYRRFTMAGTEGQLLHYRETKLSPVWTEQELLNSSGPPDIVFDPSADTEKD
jgi:hypothetical protein